jgi:hypothetical protein
MPQKGWRKVRSTFSYLATLNRLSDEVVLDVSTRDLDMGEPQTCLCGWALQAVLSEIAGVQQPNSGYNVCNQLRDQAGGTYWEWETIFLGVVGTEENIRRIETAWTMRVNTAVKRLGLVTV